ncbi:ATP/GTP-binding protein [Streptomyces sp. NPDC049590]|uniref:ATP/GTP-binding protein n=1 Tax=Streptomyces sp. NPDC049590 TaxID=3154834 RepID=UPI0034448BC9
MHEGHVRTSGEPAVAAPARPIALAPLKEGLSPEKRALAEDLRKVFLLLGVGVRRYAGRRFLDPGSVSRYLNGGRVPPWDFIAGVIADVRDLRVPLTPEAEAALRDLHRAALEGNRPSSEMEALQDQLAEADEETRRITTRQRALEEALLDREGRLAQVRSRCRKLESQLEARRGEVELWQGEYALLQEESGDLQEQVVFLQEALAVTRAELIAAEDRCHRLETRLETLQEVTGSGREDDEPPSIMVMLEEADRRSSVPELVRAVGDLELRTRKAMASELVRSASQSRAVEEVAGLLCALRQAGFDAHARTALPAMVMVRSVDDTSALARELFREGVEDYVVVLIQASVKFHQSEDLAGFASALHRTGLPAHAGSLLGAAAVVRPVPDLVSVALDLAGGELDDAVTAAMSAAAQRAVPDMVTLSLMLRDHGLLRQADALQRAAAALRSAADVAEFIRSLTDHGLGHDAEVVFAETQGRSVGHLILLVQALRDGRDWSVLSRAAQYRPVDDVAILISELHLAGRVQFAVDLLDLVVRTRTADQIAQLLHHLDGTALGAGPLLWSAARALAPAQAAALLAGLERHGLAEPAEIVFRCMLHGELVGQASLFLAALAEAGSQYADEHLLCRLANDMDPAPLASLLLALATAGLTGPLDAVIRTRYADCPILDVTLLAKQLPAGGSVRGEWVLGCVLAHVIHVRSLADQVALVSALQSSGLGAVAERLVTGALRTHGRRFRDELTRERTKHEQKVLSRTFWLPDRPRPHSHRRGKRE